MNNFDKIYLNILSDLFKNYLKLYSNDSGPLLFFNYLYNEHKELFNE